MRPIEFGVVNGVMLYECPICYALVRLSGNHADWHDEND